MILESQKFQDLPSSARIPTPRKKQVVEFWQGGKKKRILETGKSELVSPRGGVFHSAGRLFMDLGRWRGFNATYGPYYHNWNQSFGKGTVANPNINASGFIVPFNAVVDWWEMNVRRSSSEESVWQYQLLDCFGGKETVLATISDTTFSKTRERFFIQLNYEIEQGHELVIAGRKKNGDEVRKYAYASSSISFYER